MGLTVRGNFQDTAYWKADVTTNADGTATVSFSLPDNLTTWRMSAIAITKDGLVGEGQSDVRSTKDLLIRPVTPRFMIVGDKFNMGAVINNNTANDLPVDVTLEGTGITIDNGQVKQAVTVPANSAVRVNWPVTVLDAPYADLTFSGAWRRPERCEQTHGGSAARSASADLQIQHARCDGDERQCDEGRSGAE